MKCCRFEYEGRGEWGLVESFAGTDFISGILANDSAGLPTSHARTIPRISLSEAALLTPVQPSKIVCVGRNYREHAAELGNEIPKEPLIFLKPPSSLLAPGGTIVRPKISERVDHEGELGVVIGKKCRNIQPDEDVRHYIMGYTC